MYDISPDGLEIAYTSNIDEVEATSTNNEIFVAPIAGGAGKKISTSSGSDVRPRYSPNGTSLAWALRWLAAVTNRITRPFSSTIEKSGDLRELTPGFDRSVGASPWAPDSSAMFFTAEDHGTSPIWQMPLEGDRPLEVARLPADDLNFGRQNQLYFSRSSVTAPSEIARIDVSGIKNSSVHCSGRRRYLHERSEASQRLPCNRWSLSPSKARRTPTSRDS